MKIEKIVLSHAMSNCYLISSENAAICIDPGAYDKRVYEFLSENADKQRIILLTHTHFDHIGGAERLREETGVEIAISSVEEPSLRDPAMTLATRFHAHVGPFSADRKLDDREEFTVGDLSVKCFLTPGHTEGGMCYLIGNCLFSGDTLFYDTVGTTDFVGGDINKLIASIKSLLEMLPDTTEVYPGHNRPTTVAREKQYNPFLK